MQYCKHITRQMLKDSPNTLFVFGDNMVEQGFGGQAKEMRGEQNAVGIPTKNYPGIRPSDYFTDDDFAVASAKISNKFIDLFVHARQGGKIVWLLDGIGTGLAQLKERAPKIWYFIEAQKAALEKITNE